MAHVSAQPLRQGRGLVQKNHGGRLGWLARRLIPDLSTRCYLAYIRLSRAGPVRRRLDWLKGRQPPPLFNHVEVETLNRCNGGCAFCPVNRDADPRPPLCMPESLFASIVGQLADLGYQGFFGLYSNNEPLLDNRLECFAAEARERLPGALLNLSTNGTLLDVDRFRRLMRHFDRVVVNNYAERPALHDRAREIADFCRTAEGERLLAGKTLEISLRHDRDVLTSRAGNAPNRPPPARPLSLPCLLPYSQLVVRPDGKISLCCNDALGQETLGDLTRESLSEAWNGEARRRAQRLMAEAGRGGLALCRRCDFVKHDVY